VSVCPQIFTYGMTPYSGISNMNMVGELKKGTRLQRPRGCPDDVYNCFLKCWDASYELRCVGAVMWHTAGCVY